MRKQLTVIILFWLWCSFLTASVLQASCDIEDKHLNFVENKGQWPAHIQYQAELPSTRLFLESNQLTYVLLKPEDVDRIHHLRHNPTAGNEEDKVINAHAFQIQISGAKANPIVESSCKAQAYRNYFIGKDATKWASKVGLFHQIDYRSVYEGIDMRLYSKDGNMKYDFIVEPNADVSQITLEYKGINYLAIKNNQLHIETSVNTIVEQAPFAYQYIDGKEVIVPCRFALNNNKVRFEFPEGYHKSQELIIDPELVFSTYTGSNVDNWGFTSTYDNDGNMYAGGVAFGSGYPTTLGAYQISFTGGDTDNYLPSDISVTKFTADGSQQIYSTYIGGSDANELPHSMIVNDNNELIILGTTGSFDYPTTATAFDRTFAGGDQVNINSINFPFGSDIIVTKLNSDGSDLLGSTFIGGSENDGLNLSANLFYNYGDESRGEVVVDKEGYIYGASCTQSSNFSVTSGSFQTGFGGGLQDACVFKFRPDLSGLEWSGYLGGSRDDAAYSVKIANDGTAYVAGGTRSNNFPTTSISLNNSYLGGGADGFLTHINTAGSNILQATYLGTSDYDQAYFVDMDGAGDVYALGQTEGNYSVQGDVFRNANGGHFIHKLSNDLRTTQFSTIFGRGDGDPDISPSAFLVDTCNQIYVSGWGGPTGGIGSDGFVTNGLPITNDAFQTSTDGSDFYFMVLSENAQSLAYATFFGGDQSREHVDGGTSRFAKNGAIYQAICAGCGSNDDLPTTLGAWSNTNRSDNCNLGAVKFALTGPVANFNIKTTACSAIVNFDNNSVNAESFFWDFGDGETATDINPSHEYSEGGTYNVRLIVTKSTPCFLTDTLTQVLMLEGVTASVNIEAKQFCMGDDATNLVADIAGGTWSGQGVLDSNTGLFSPNIGVGEYSVTYTVSTGECEVSDTEIIAVSELPDANFELLQAEYCGLEDIAVVLNPATEGGVFVGDGVSDNVFVPANINNPEEETLVSVAINYTVTVNGCTAESTQTTDVYFPPSATFKVVDFCEGDTPEAFTPNNEGGIWSGTGVDADGVFNPETAGNYLITYTIGKDGCTQSTTNEVGVFSLPDASFTSIDFCIGDAAATFEAATNGGVWSGEGIDSETGVFDPSGLEVGSYEITYTLTDEEGCENSTTQTISVIDSPDASFTVVDFCENDEAAAFESTISGGTWSGEGIDSETGIFDPSTVTVGAYEISYAVGGGGCFASQIQIVNVFALPDASFTVVNFCENDAATAFEPTISGGTWSGEGIDGVTGIFDPTTVAVGTYEITYTITDANTCSNASTEMVNVFALPDASFTTTNFCENDVAVALEPTISGGTWSGEGIDSETGVFDPTTVSTGTYEITYTIVDENTCSNSTTEEVNVFTLPDASFTVINFCENDVAVALEPTISGGTWSGDGIDSETGIFDPTTVSTGTYEITYTIGEGDCQSSSTQQISVYELPNSSFTSADFCQGNSPNALISLTEGGLWSGEGIDSETGIFDPTTVSAGSYEITYTITDENACSNVSTETVNVFTLPDASFTTTNFCKNDAPQALQANNIGGIWGGEGINAETGVFDPNIVATGTYVVTYTITDENGCSNFSTAQINVFALPDASFTAINFCRSDAPQALQANIVGGVWSGSGIDSQTGVFNPNNLASGTYEITYTVGVGDCQASSTQQISVYELPNSSFMAADFCQGDSPSALTPFVAGGIWSGEGIDPITGIFDPNTVATGSYTIAYTLSDANNCINTSGGLVNVFAKPIINIVAQANCLEGTDTFEITISVSGGTGNSFQLTGDITAIVAENESITAVFASGTTPQLVATDPLTGCQSTRVLEALTCIACAPDAGTMNSELQIICAEGTTNLATTNPIVEENQVLVYALHSAPTFSENELLAISTTGNFSFEDLENGEYYQEYYSSAIVGFPLDNGVPPIGDICTVISETSTPILFLAPTSFKIDEFCQGETGDYIVTVALEGGLPQYDGNANYQLLGDFAGEVEIGETFTVVYSTGTVQSYNFIATTDELGCEGTTIASTPFECTKTPIELLYFEGEIQAEGNLLKWLTATEVDNDYFLLERSVDGSNFETIAQLKGAGTSLTPTTYTFLDKEAIHLSTAYYRYRQVDINGTESNSSVLLLQRQEFNTSIIDILPNPVRNKVLITFTSMENNLVNIHLFDVSGRKVFIKSNTTHSGLNQIEIDLSSFNSGIYFLQLNDKIHFSTKKIMIE